MSLFVVDCSVAAAAYLKEAGCENAGALMASDSELWAPDLIESEFGNVLWKCCLRGELSETEASQMLSSFRRSRIRRRPSGDLVQRAFELALRTKRSVYDCLYLALAADLDTVLYTGDMRFCNSLQSTSMAKHVAPISSFPLST